VERSAEANNVSVPTILLAVLIAVVILNSIALLALAADVGRLRLRLDPSSSELAVVPNEGLAIAAGAPVGELLTMPGDVPIAVQTGTRLLVFVAASCDPCRRLWPDLKRFAKEGAHPVTVVVGDDPAEFLGDRNVTVVFDRDGGIASRWRVRRTPFLYFVADGHVRAKGVANRYEQIITLLDGRGRAGPDEWATLEVSPMPVVGDPPQ
jgi:thiol-disulfide isomerase/thioredoxin